MTPAAYVEAVHLDQQLVEGLLAFVVPAAHTGAAVAPDRVDLVDEDDGRRVLLGLFEQVTYPARADADEHLDEVRAGDGVERHAGLACDSTGEQRLARAGLTVEKDALGDLGADRLELRRLGEELLDLLQLLDRLVGAGDVGEGGLGHVLGDQLRLGLRELHDAATAALHLGQQEEEDQRDDDDREQRGDQRPEDARLRHLDVVALDLAGFDLRLHLVDQLHALVAEPLGVLLLAVVEDRLDVLVTFDEGDFLDRAVADAFHHLVGGDLLVAAAVRDRLQHHENSDDAQDYPKPRAFEGALEVHIEGRSPRSSC
jgi:hypothetical protein